MRPASKSNNAYDGSIGRSEPSCIPPWFSNRGVLTKAIPYRGYDYVPVGGELLIVDPHLFEIVAIPQA
jgi:hypothetical protein